MLREDVQHALSSLEELDARLSGQVVEARESALGRPSSEAAAADLQGGGGRVQRKQRKQGRGERRRGRSGGEGGGVHGCGVSTKRLVFLLVTSHACRLSQ
jgi:hypothetical protein